MSDKHNTDDKLKFDVPLSFYQELRLVSHNKFEPLSLTKKNEGNLHGTLKLRFKKDLSKAKYKLYVYNAVSSNNKIILSHLHNGTANINGIPVTVSLYAHSGKNVDGFLTSGVIRNENINPTSEANSIASLYYLIRQESLYCDVHSTLYPDGVLRGQIF